MPDPDDQLSAGYVRAVLDAFSNAVHSKDVDRVLRVVTNDALVIGSERGEMGFGNHGVKDFIQRVFERYPPIHWEWDLVEARADGSHAWFFVEGNVLYGDERQRYRASGVCRRDDLGEWKLAMFHGSTPEG
ncbi:MAG: nuclear transport factor 2 family protein [Actinomycetota bacterium]|nr:nuclear transport factor 2 family protein [Actinomycetota bacterium]